MTESEIQTDIVKMLCEHPRVAWVMVVTTGKFKVKGGYVTVGHYITEDQRRLTGMSDIIGQMRDGRVLVVETKKPKEVPTVEQYEYMELVNSNGGLGFWADSVRMAMQWLEMDDL